MKESPSLNLKKCCIKLSAKMKPKGTKVWLAYNRNMSVLVNQKKALSKLRIAGIINIINLLQATAIK